MVGGASDTSLQIVVVLLRGVYNARNCNRRQLGFKVVGKVFP